MIQSCRIPLVFSRAAFLGVACFLMLLGGCSLFGGGSGGEASVAPGSDALIIRNNTADSLYYDAIDPDVLALVLRVSFETPDAYPRIGPGETLRLPYSEIFGYEAGDEIAVTLWRLVPDPTSRTGFRGQFLVEKTVRP